MMADLLNNQILSHDDLVRTHDLNLNHLSQPTLLQLIALCTIYSTGWRNFTADNSAPLNRSTFCPCRKISLITICLYFILHPNSGSQNIQCNCILYIIHPCYRFTITRHAIFQYHILDSYSQRVKI